tara:strand:+ start:813 stop:968 length:156 start_codon:yes stop_codon:yes gene_type:complete
MKIIICVVLLILILEIPWIKRGIAKQIDSQRYRSEVNEKLNKEKDNSDEGQ